MQTTYRPGSWSVIVLPGALVALPPETPGDVVARMWERMPGQPTLATAIDVLASPVGAALDALPWFAVVIAEGRDLRVALRGEVTARVATESGERELSGADVTTLSERFVVDASRAEVSLAQAARTEPPGTDLSGTDLPVVGGVVLAGWVAVDLTVDATPPSADVLVPAPVRGGSETALSELAAPDPTAPDPAAPDPAAPDPAAADPTAPDPAAAQPATPAESGQDPVPVELTLAPPADEADGMWDATLLSPPRPPARAVGGSAPDGSEGDHDGSTVSVAELRSLRGDSFEGAVGASPATPPAASGRIRLASGQVVTLDRTVVIGRRPRSTRASGSSLPHLIAVDSPEQDISRSHLEIRPEGDTVVVVDLHTTNGSTLLRPGSDPVRLHPGEPTLVVSGDVVDLGDGVSVTFEDLP